MALLRFRFRQYFWNKFEETLFRWLIWKFFLIHSLDLETMCADNDDVCWSPRLNELIITQWMKIYIATMKVANTKTSGASLRGSVLWTNAYLRHFESYYCILRWIKCIRGHFLKKNFVSAGRGRPALVEPWYTKVVNIWFRTVQSRYHWCVFNSTDKHRTLTNSVSTYSNNSHRNMIIHWW
jgi:hypothetical protein